MRALAVAIIALFGLLGPALASEEDWADCKAEDPERSIAGCTRIISAAKEPSQALAIAYNNRGVGYRSKGELLRAFADYTEALRLDPTYARAYYNRGLAHEEDGELARALEDYDAALQIEPDYAKARASRALLLAEYDQIDEALDDFELAFKSEARLYLKPDADLSNKIVTSSLYDQRINEDRRLVILRVATSLNPQRSDLYNSRAEILIARGAFAEAIADLNETIRVAPKYPASYSNRCRALAEAGGLEQATKDCDEAIRLGVFDTGPHYTNRGFLNLRKSRFKEAEQDLSRAIALLPLSVENYRLRAEAYDKLGQRAKAVADYRTAVSMKPRPGITRDPAAKAEAAEALRRLDSNAPSPPAPSPPPPGSPAPAGSPAQPGKRADNQPPAGQSDAAFKRGDSFRDCRDCPEMIVMPAGEFVMGSPPGEATPEDGEGPPHKVAIQHSFAVGKFEITQGQFESFVKATEYDVGDRCFIWTGREWKNQTGSFRAPGFAQTPQHPATCLSWKDAKAYITWLSQITGKTYRLLTEAEWEYAARAGTTARYHFGNDADALCGFANGADRTAKGKYSRWTTVANCSDGHVNTAPVGSFKPNAFGLYDMHGNVSEWVEDCFQNGYENAPTDGSAAVVANCRLRVLRGGSWIGQPKALRSASRLRRPADDRYGNNGFRVARTLLP